MLSLTLKIQDIVINPLHKPRYTSCQRNTTGLNLLWKKVSNYLCPLWSCREGILICIDSRPPAKRKHTFNMPVLLFTESGQSSFGRCEPLFLPGSSDDESGKNSLYFHWFLHEHHFPRALPISQAGEPPWLWPWGKGLAISITVSITIAIAITYIWALLNSKAREGRGLPQFQLWGDFINVAIICRSQGDVPALSRARNREEAKFRLRGQTRIIPTACRSCSNALALS